MQASGLVETRHGIGSFVLEPACREALGIDPATRITRAAASARMGAACQPPFVTMVFHEPFFT